VSRLAVSGSTPWNGGTEAINGVIEKTRRLAHGFRTFTNRRVRILLTADGTRPYRRPSTKSRSAERADLG
jgi:Transposase